MSSERKLVWMTESFFVSSSGVGNNTVVTESNGDSVPGLDSAELWPAEADAEAMSPSSLSLEEKVGTEGSVGKEEVSTEEDTEVEGHLEELLEEKHCCERLSPQSEVDSSDADPAELEAIFIAPLDGCQAELRGRVIKEVRKPGRSE